MNSADQLPALTSSQQEVLDIVADKLFVDKCRWVRGLDLRRRMRADDREKKQARVQQLVPNVLTLHGTAREGSYSITPIGALKCKHAAAITELAQELQAFIVSLADSTPDFTAFNWEAVKQNVQHGKRPLVDDDFEIVSFVLFCIGAWGGSGSVSGSRREFTWNRPLDPQLEDLLEVNDAATLFERVQSHILQQNQGVNSEIVTQIPIAGHALQDEQITPWGYAALAAGALICSIAILIGLATSSGRSSGQIFYVLLVTLGITVGAFLFGAMKSHARMHGRIGYGAYDFGGPICAVILTVVGGFQFSSPTQTFSVLVRASFNGATPSSALLSVGDAVIAGSFRPDGVIRFDAIPSRYLGEPASMKMVLGSCKLQVPLEALRIGTLDAPNAKTPECDVPGPSEPGAQIQKDPRDSPPQSFQNGEGGAAPGSGPPLHHGVEPTPVKPGTDTESRPMNAWSGDYEVSEAKLVLYGLAHGTYPIVADEADQFFLTGWNGAEKPAKFTLMQRSKLDCERPRTGNLDTTWFYGSQWRGPDNVRINFAVTSACADPAIHKYMITGLVDHKAAKDPQGAAPPANSNTVRPRPDLSSDATGCASIAARVDHPVLDLQEPIERQIALYAGDHVRIVGSDAEPIRVKFGPEWEGYQADHDYVVWANVDDPFVPSFQGETRHLKLEVHYSCKIDKPRDLRVPSSGR